MEGSFEGLSARAGREGWGYGERMRDVCGKGLAAANRGSVIMGSCFAARGMGGGSFARGAAIAGFTDLQRPSGGMSGVVSMEMPHREAVVVRCEGACGEDDQAVALD